MLRAQSCRSWQNNNKVFHPYWCVCALVLCVLFCATPVRADLADSAGVAEVNPESNPESNAERKNAPIPLDVTTTASEGIEPLEEVDVGVVLLKKPIFGPKEKADIDSGNGTGGTSEAQKANIERDADAAITDVRSGKGANDGAPTDFAKIVSRQDEDILIFQLYIGDILLSNGILTYYNFEDDEYHLPLNDLVEILEFPIEVDETTAKGWFIREDKDFSLDLDKGNVVIDGETIRLKPGEVERYYDGIYVTLSTIEEWFPVTADVDFSQLAFVLKSLEPLPIEIRRARDLQRSFLDENIAFSKNELVKQKPPLFTFPFVDTNLQSQYNNRDGVEKTLSFDYTTLINGIFLNQDARLSINDTTSDDQSPDLRLTLRREDAERKLLGLGFSEYEVGDISTSNIPLIASSSAGRGLSFTNSLNDLGIGGQSSAVTIRGELPVGFQVDIMRNGQLLDFIEEPNEDGEYIFDDLSVFTGLNVFELVFYGPQGQTRTEERRIFVPENPVAKGDFNYQVSLIQDDKNLLTSRSSETEDTGKLRSVLEAEYGLLDNLSVYTGLARYATDGEHASYGVGGVNFSYRGIRFDTSYAVNNEDGQAYSFGAQSVFKGFRWKAEHREYKDFVSEDTDNSSLPGILMRETSFATSGLLPFRFLRGVPIAFDISRFSNDEGGERYETDLRLTKTFKKLRFTTSVSQIVQTDRERETDLNLQVSSRISNKLNLRGDILYTLEPKSVFESISLTSDYKIDDKQNFRLGLSRSGSEDPIHTFLAGYSRKFDRFQMGSSLSINDNSEILALINASFGFYYDSIQRQPYFTADRVGNKGAIAARVFIDENADSVFNETEEPLYDVFFEGPRSVKGLTTDEEGYIFLPSLESYAPNTLSVSNLSLVEPSYKDATGLKDYLVRPSQILKQDFPIILVGEVDGMVLAVRNGREEPASSIILEVVNDAGKIISSTEFRI